MVSVFNLIDSMKVKITLCIAGLFFALGCQNTNQVEKPEKLLSTSEMKDLIYDMVLLDAAMSVNENKLEELDIEMLEFLSKKYEIDSVQLKQNILYYNMRFDENVEIYEEAKDSISKLEKAYDSISKLSDSLRKVKLKKLDSIKKIDTLPRNKKLKSQAEN